jgi:polysaccharide pyruvyl transferase WcaK-like protein
MPEAASFMMLPRQEKRWRFKKLQVGKLDFMINSSTQAIVSLPRTTPPKIVICGEVESSNLGDTVIAHSFSHIIQELVPIATIQFLDMSLRKFSQPAPGQNTRLERLFWRMVRRTCSREVEATLWWWFKVKSQRYVQYQQILQGATALFIGGGNLLADNQFNFPLKIYGIAQCARQMGIPVYYYGCGVNAHWSGVARQLYKQVLSQARSIAVRDPVSASRLAQNVPSITDKLSVVWDVAVHCGEAYGVTQQGNAIAIGLGICAPSVLARHTWDDSRGFFQDETLIQFWVSIAQALSAQNLPFQFFINGSPSDRQFANQVVERVAAAGIPVRPVLAPTHSEELVRIISSFKAIVAFRLHACIIAYALGIPSVGLKWDTKVESFFQQCQRSSYCLDSHQTSPPQLIEKLLQAIAEPDSPDIAKQESRHQVSQLLSSIISPNLIST